MEAPESQGEGEELRVHKRFSPLPPGCFFQSGCPVFPGGWFPPPASKFQSEKDHLAPANVSLASLQRARLSARLRTKQEPEAYR